MHIYSLTLYSASRGAAKTETSAERSVSWQPNESLCSLAPHRNTNNTHTHSDTNKQTRLEDNRKGFRLQDLT